jgi:hypothetical protein
VISGIVHIAISVLAGPWLEGHGWLFNNSGIGSSIRSSQGLSSSLSSHINIRNVLNSCICSTMRGIGVRDCGESLGCWDSLLSSVSSAIRGC